MYRQSRRLTINLITENCSIALTSVSRHFLFSFIPHRIVRCHAAARYFITITFPANKSHINIAVQQQQEISTSSDKYFGRFATISRPLYHHKSQKIMNKKHTRTKRQHLIEYVEIINEKKKPKQTQPVAINMYRCTDYDCMELLSYYRIRCVVFIFSPRR